MAPELVTSAEGMEVMEQELAEKITKLDEEIKQEPKIIKGGSVRKRRRRFLKKASSPIKQRPNSACQKV
ncbi:hypothetical protein [Limosilactobacillus reuteri]|mgnify:CR=1 FL=1|nr:hypothetical protein [Limosilactobacillus reuteri]